MRKDFFGHKETKIHDQRLNIPKEFKSKFSEDEELIVTIGPKRRIAIFTKENFQETISILSKGDRRQRLLSQNLRRFAMSEQTLEGPGRIRLDSDLMKLSNITKEVMLEGAGNFVSIWDAEKYKEHLSTQFNTHLNEIDEMDYDV